MMEWEKPATLTANTPYKLIFHLLDPQGKPATDMQPYLGMPGHAAFVKTDGTAFAHTHPGWFSRDACRDAGEREFGPLNERNRCMGGMAESRHEHEQEPVSSDGGLPLWLSV